MFFPCHTEDPLIPKTVPLPLRAEILQRLRWEGQRDVPLWVSAGNLCWIPFAFFNKIQNHKLCKARKLKGQTLSGVHFKSEVQNAFNDIIAKGKNLFECKLLFEQGMNSQTVVQCSLVSWAWGPGGRRGGGITAESPKGSFTILEISLIFPLDLEPTGPEERRCNIKIRVIF